MDKVEVMLAGGEKFVLASDDLPAKALAEALTSEPGGHIASNDVRDWLKTRRTWLPAVGSRWVRRDAIQAVRIVPPNRVQGH